MTDQVLKKKIVGRFSSPGRNAEERIEQAPVVEGRYFFHGHILFKGILRAPVAHALLPVEEIEQGNTVFPGKRKRALIPPCQLLLYKSGLLVVARENQEHIQADFLVRMPVI